MQSGHATFELDGERVDAPTGTFVFASPGVKRTAFAEEPQTTIVAIGGTPGKAYEVGGFELWAPLGPLYEAGEYAEAADRGRELAEAHPEYAGLLYNVACCESLAGRKAEAIEHLRRAIKPIRAVPRVRCRGLGLRCHPGRAGVQGARGVAARHAEPAPGQARRMRCEGISLEVMTVAFALSCSGCIGSASTVRRLAPTWFEVSYVPALGNLVPPTQASTMRRIRCDSRDRGLHRTSFDDSAASDDLDPAAVRVAHRPDLRAGATSARYGPKSRQHSDR